MIACGMTSVAFAEPVHTIGWIENVKLTSKNITMNAKIDTGADNSSIHATNISLYEKDNIKMVRFTVESEDGEVAEFDQPLIRVANIKRKGAEPLARPVVSVNLCIGKTLKTAHVNLANRENFEYRMLIGRSYLQDLYLVNSSAKYTVDPDCQSETEEEI